MKIDVKIEVESHEDYDRGKVALVWLMGTLMDGRLPAELRRFGEELSQALDDYAQIHWPLGRPK